MNLALTSPEVCEYKRKLILDGQNFTKLRNYICNAKVWIRYVYYAYTFRYKCTYTIIYTAYIGISIRNISVLKYTSPFESIIHIDWIFVRIDVQFCLKMQCCYVYLIYTFRIYLYLYIFPRFCMWFNKIRLAIYLTWYWIFQ